MKAHMETDEFEKHVQEVFNEFIVGDSFVASEEALIEGLRALSYLSMETEVNLGDIKGYDEEINSLRKMQAVAQMLLISLGKLDIRTKT